MSGPYRVEEWTNSTSPSLCATVRGPGIGDKEYRSLASAHEDARRLNAAYAAGRAASGREAEIRGMERAIRVAKLHDCTSASGDPLDETYRQGYRDARDHIVDALRAEIDQALTPTEDREYQIAVEKLMEEPG